MSRPAPCIHTRYRPGGPRGTRPKGSIMQTKPKSNSIITHSIREDGIIEFRVIGAGVIEFDPDKMSEAMGQRAALHGVIQRVSDGGAMSRNPDNGRPATPAEKFARMQAIAEHMMSGTDQWKMVVATGGGTDGGLTVMALIRAGFADSVDAANALVDKLALKRGVDRKAALAEWASTKEVASAIADIRASRAKGDANALLDEIEGE